MNSSASIFAGPGFSDLARGDALSGAADAGAADYRMRYLGDAMRGYEFYRAALAEVPSPEAARP